MTTRETDLSLPAGQKRSEPAVKSERHGAGELDRAAAGVSFGSSSGQDHTAARVLPVSRPNSAGAAQHILRLQRQYGNRYVQRLLGMSRSVAGGGEIEPEIEERIEHKRGGGHPLAEAERAHFGQAFGTGLDGVRVHTDSEADALNGSLNAVAFTTGQDVFFSEGSYRIRPKAGGCWAMSSPMLYSRGAVGCRASCAWASRGTFSRRRRRRQGTSLRR
jgi:hypothetical protein